MTLSEWDGTPWGGTAVLPEANNVVRMLPAKAATGWQAAWNGYNTPSSSVSTRNPLKRMREEQALYWTHPWVKAAERAVTRKVAGLPWHLENTTEDEVDDFSDPILRAIRTLLEKPQATLPIQERQVGIDSWTNLVSVTSRHLGLCGMTHWYLDGLDGAGTPAAILYVNPARLYPVTTTNGHLVDWSLDPKDDTGAGGTLLGRENVLTFYLEPPDAGAISTGLVHVAWTKARLSTSIDGHLTYTLDTGGRMSGLVSPKEGWMGDEQYKTLVQELRSTGEINAHERRLTIVRGPVEFDQTSATPEQIQETDLAKMTRDDIFSIWGVPQSQAPIALAAGLNSGETKAYDEAILMQGSVHDRVRIIRDTVQFGLLDRWPSTPQLVIEEPEFDDATPAFERASKATNLPLTRNQRLALIGLDPLPEYGPDGAPLGLAIDLPNLLVTVGQGEEAPTPGPAPRFRNAPQPEPAPIVTIPTPPLLPATTEPAKATLSDVRADVLRRFEPVIRRAMAAFLADQRREVAERVVEKGEHLARKGVKDVRVWWDAKAWDARLADALRAGIQGVAGQAAQRVTKNLRPAAKADTFTESVIDAVLNTVGLRVKDINATTRDAIAAAVEEGFADGLSPAQIGQLIEGLPAFDSARAELVARTETALAYNEAAITSYRSLDVERVEVIDGDQDEICAAADGQTWTLDEALGNPLGHPNCVRDFVPVVAKAEPKPRSTIYQMEYDDTGRLIGVREEQV